MTISHEIDIASLRPLIAWPYFLHAWGLPLAGKEKTADQLLADANALLDRWQAEEERIVKVALVGLPAYSAADDIVLPTVPATLPMLRQQKPDPECGACLCLADFLPPQGKETTLSLFATTVAPTEELATADPYKRLLAQTLSDRLAEAAAEKLSESAPGLRFSVGYPSLPDMSMNFLLAPLLRFGALGISLTESGMMQPHASVSGLIIDHPAARYFSIGPVADDQLADYARRRHTTTNELKKYLRQ